MKLNVEITLDGMIRALRSRGHGLADARERDMMTRPANQPRYPSPRPFREEDRSDDRRRR
jgi:hypothetical protein